MRSSNRLLIIFGVAIGALVLASVILVFAFRDDKPITLLPEDSPEGTVQRYFIALQNEDYITAYDFIAPLPNDKMPYEEWKGSYYRSVQKNVWKATIGESKITRDEATVDVVIEVFRPQGPFSDPISRNQIMFSLKKSELSWIITSPVDLWWLY